MGNKPKGRRNQWTPQDIRTLQCCYGKMPCSKLQKKYLPDKTQTRIYQKASELGLTGPSRAYSEEETSIIRQYIRKEISLEEAIERTGRTESGIRHYVQKLTKDDPNKTRKIKWTKKETKALRKHYSSMSIKELQAIHLPNRTILSIQQKAFALGLVKKQEKPWTENEDQLILDANKNAVYAQGLSREVKKIMPEMPNRSKREILDRRKEIASPIPAAAFRPGDKVKSFTIITKLDETHWLCQCKCGRTQSIAHLTLLKPNPGIYCPCQSEAEAEMNLNNYADGVLREVAWWESKNKDREDRLQYTLGLFGMS